MKTSIIRIPNGRKAEVYMKKQYIIIALLCMISILSCFSGCVDTSGLPAITMNPHAQNDDASSSSSKAESGKEPAETEPETDPKEQKNMVAASWFDDAVFVGDSVTLKLSYYCDEDSENKLSDAKFFCAGSLGYTNALWDLDQEGAVHPYYQGQNYQSKDCAAVTGASKVFIMLGMNDLSLYGIDESLESARTLINDILQQSPGVTIYIQSVTPIIAGKEDEDSNNTLIRKFNGELEIMCDEKGYRYLDVYNELADKDGYLPLQYCSDPQEQGIHFTDEACDLWIQYLKENVS